MIDLGADFAGLHFENPFILPSAQSVRTGSMIRRAFEAGWGGAITQTITPDGYETSNVRPRLAAFWENDVVVGLMNIELTSTRSVGAWLPDIRDLKKDFPARPLLASIAAGADDEKGWRNLAKLCEDSGVDGLELNVSIPHGLTETNAGAMIGVDQDLTARVTSWVASAVDVPVIVKLTPIASDIVAVARAAKKAGASGVTATNNMRALAGIDIYSVTPLPSVGGRSTFGGYAGAGLKPVTLRCVAEIAANTDIDVAACGGVEPWKDGVEHMLCGATLIQVYTGAVKGGFSAIHELTGGLAGYTSSRGLQNVGKIVGEVLPKIVPHSELVRDPNVVAMYDPRTCIRCGQCFTACEDSGFQAIALDADSWPQINSELCDGCGLCEALCPVPSCIEMGRRDA